MNMGIYEILVHERRWFKKVTVIKYVPFVILFNCCKCGIAINLHEWSNPEYIKKYCWYNTKEEAEIVLSNYKSMRVL